MTPNQIMRSKKLIQIIKTHQSKIMVNVAGEGLAFFETLKAAGIQTTPVIKRGGTVLESPQE